MEEMASLGRRGADITAVSGYAGGTRVGPNNRVCYHNMQNLADYGSLGHAEVSTARHSLALLHPFAHLYLSLAMQVVQVEVPVSSLPAFAKRYFALFGTRGYRHDPQDAGGEVISRASPRERACCNYVETSPSPLLAPPPSRSTVLFWVYREALNLHSFP